ncbi:GNAT family N-acetyltransferase [Micrococcoides hystricis]|uniref:GNAT family N-acetyltransferase n=1 Tax=Micrococcoides hystricis TaxID=1572761 RepID=A0ABV6P8P4_9MICC
MRILPQHLPWLPSAKRALAAVNEPGLRILGAADEAELLALVNTEPIHHVFLRDQLNDGIGPHKAGGFFLGYFQNDQLSAACWLGANVVPTNTTMEIGALFGAVARNLGRLFASVFGPAKAVHGIWSQLHSGRQNAFGVRHNQPLMAISAPATTVPPSPQVRTARTDEFGLVLPASAAMFREELGFSPFINGDNSYQERVKQLIRHGHTLIGFDDQDRLNFKADLGTVTAECAQVQGVWVPPHLRGKGVARGGMAAVVEYGLGLSTHVSLYVNDYNTPARRVYEHVGFEQIGAFATVLF